LKQPALNRNIQNWGTRRRTAESGSYRRCANIACFDLAWTIADLPAGLQPDEECVSKIKMTLRSQDGNQGRIVEGSKFGVRINISFGYFRVVQALPLQSLNTQVENTFRWFSLRLRQTSACLLCTSYEVISLRYFQGAARYRTRKIRRSIKGEQLLF
jgi:hypothetical protein